MSVTPLLLLHDDVTWCQTIVRGRFSQYRGAVGAQCLKCLSSRQWQSRVVSSDLCSDILLYGCDTCSHFFPHFLHPVCVRADMFEGVFDVYPKGVFSCASIMCNKCKSFTVSGRKGRHINEQSLFIYHVRSFFVLFSGVPWDSPVPLATYLLRAIFLLANVTPAISHQPFPVRLSAQVPAQSHSSWFGALLPVSAFKPGERRRRSHPNCSLQRRGAAVRHQAAGPGSQHDTHFRVKMWFKEKF